MNVKNWYKTHILGFFLSLFLVILCVVVIGYVVAPTIFYDQWIWKYYWGPVVADATSHQVSWHGVVANEGYSVISEITYGIILVCALFGLYQLLKKLQIVVDWYFCLALMPYILFGPVTRVLEDTNYFSEPAVYWFISPLIYVQTTLFVLLFLFLGFFLEKKVKQPRNTLLYLFSVFVFIDVVYSIIWVLQVPYGMYRIEPGVFYVLSVLAFLPVLYRFLKKQAMTKNTVIFSGGLFILLPCLYLIGRWMTGQQWDTSFSTRFDVFFLIIGLVTLVTFAVYFVARVFQKHKNIAVYKNPLNLAMIAGHLVDGFSSYISIYDPLHMGLPGYLEKHPASNLLMEIWPPLFPIVKLLLIISVIYIFDVLYKKELKHNQRLVNLIKIGIFILGISPGVRDLLRVTMGV